ncbi:conserved hypothetical protein [Mucinivorans hirudinis]|uniref:DUF4325 domain-containing protein n=1 Tax=Mucinivorans hirudinis TaxID=1433126 RepID=A0A060RCP2_9BACT|nr:conserved hypothetical protein [Mucinivorans hirudinis]
MKTSYLEVDNNEIIFQNFKDTRVVGEFIKVLNGLIEQRCCSAILNFKNVKEAFPNVCVPIAGIIENLSYRGIEFDFYYQSDYLKQIGIKQPFNVSENKEVLKNGSLNKIWRFDTPEDAYVLVDLFSQELQQKIVCEKGVIEGFEWAINEVLDNVVQHSGKNFGYVMGQIHNSTKHVVFCVYDTGQGIYNSLLKSEHKPQSPSEAIKLAVREGVTRDKKIGQGNGLWGLHQIVRENLGMLNITSGPSCYKLKNGDEPKTFDNIPQLPYDNGCTIDFQLEYNKPISISKALGGYQPVNFNLENLENSQGEVEIKLRDRVSGVGTRVSGEKIRNEVINLYNQSNRSIVFDFSSLKIISSSFADELIGKLVTEYGFYGFNNIFKLKNMNSDIQSIVQRSVAQRMIESFGEQSH